MATISGAIVTVTGGYVVAHGTITADAQAWSSTAAWNNAGVAFTHIKANVTNTASNAASKLIDLQAGGVSMFSVTIAGSVTGAEMTSQGSFSAASGGSLIFGSRGSISAPSDGVFRLLDTAGTSFARLQFGGTTSSFPALKRSSAILAVRLADDSADAALTCAALTASGTGGWTAGGVAGTNRIDYNNSVANTFALLNSGNSAAGIAVAGLTSQSTLVAVVTGTQFKYGVTAATAVAVASTHKIEIRDTAGTTYYLLATT